MNPDELRALADALEPMAKAPCFDGIDIERAAVYLRAQAEAQPVAWRTFDGEGNYDYRDYELNEDYADEWNRRNPKHVGWVESLYTRPAPAAPQVETMQTVVALTSERDDLRKQIDECSRMLARQARTIAQSVDAGRDAERYRWLASHCRHTSEHWGGRWSIVVEGHAPAPLDSESDFSAAIDAAMSHTRSRN